MRIHRFGLYSSHDQLREHLQTFVEADNFATRLKTLKGLTVFEYVNKCWTEKPKQFIYNSSCHVPEVNGSAFVWSHLAISMLGSNDQPVV